MAGMVFVFEPQTSEYHSTLERVAGHSAFSGWRMTSCYALQAKRETFIFEVFDREDRPHWLFFGPWREWERVGSLWSHLAWVNRTMVSLSPLFRHLGPVLAEVDWIGFQDGFVGLSARNSGRPFLASSGPGRMVGLESLIQVTGFLRLLQVGPASSEPGKVRARLNLLEAKSLELAGRLKKVIPDRPHFRRWESFYLRNLRSLVSSKEIRLTLSLGAGLDRCIKIGKNGGLLVDCPFAIGEDLEGMDLCALLCRLEGASDQDLQYLVDFYFNRQIPSSFFTLLAHCQLTRILKDLDKKGSDPRAFQAGLEKFNLISKYYESFRTPVPTWYQF